MRWLDVVFNEDATTKRLRHIMFWAVWWVYFLFSFFFLQDGTVVKSIPILIGHITLTYFILYSIDKWIFRSHKQVLLLFVLPVAFGTLTVYSYYCYQWLLPSKTYSFWSSVNGGPLSALKILLAAVAIKLTKRWYIKEAENIRLRKDKAEAELQLLKAQVQPAFLFQSLDHIHELSAERPDKAAAELLQLSELLSYILYDSKRESVRLNKEIACLKNYLSLENAAMGDNLDIALSVNGNAEGKRIPPLLLMPFLENSIQQCKKSGLEKLWISIEFNFSDDDITMRLLNGKMDKETGADYSQLENARKRISMLYAGRHELKIHAEEEMMMTQLTIKT